MNNVDNAADLVDAYCEVLDALLKREREHEALDELTLADYWRSLYVYNAREYFRDVSNFLHTGEYRAIPDVNDNGKILITVEGDIRATHMTPNWLRKLSRRIRSKEE